MMSVSDVSGSTFYKVLDLEGRSCFGGCYQWSLPQKQQDGSWVPGEWTHDIYNPVMCQRGWHATTEPWKNWAAWDMRLFVIQLYGIEGREDDKVVARRARLISEVDLPSWWVDAHAFVHDQIKRMRWFNPDGRPKSSWVVFDNWKDAEHGFLSDRSGEDKPFSRDDIVWDICQRSARRSAISLIRSMARLAVMDTIRNEVAMSNKDCVESYAAGWEVETFASVAYAGPGINFPDNVVNEVMERWSVYEKGYGLFGVRNGKYYVYKRLDRSDA